MKTSILVILFFLLLSGCSSKNNPSYVAKLTPYEKPTKKELPPYKLKKHNAVTLALYEEYVKWYGTPYKFGGESLNGVDCSALVESIYRDAFGLKIPRTTSQQVKIGYKISKNSTKEGDIVFFKTGYNTRHSGIYLENGHFINTSSKYGVTISSLHNPYWKSKYWQSRRVIP